MMIDGAREEKRNKKRKKKEKEKEKEKERKKERRKTGTSRRAPGQRRSNEEKKENVPETAWIFLTGQGEAVMAASSVQW